MVPMESSLYCPAFGLVVPISVATKEIHCNAYIVGQVVSHNAPESLQANEVMPLLEDYFLHTKYLGEIVQGFQTFLVKHHTLWYCHIVSHPSDCNFLSLYWEEVPN